MGATVKYCGQRLNIHMIDLNHETEDDGLAGGLKFVVICGNLYDSFSSRGNFTST